MELFTRHFLSSIGVLTLQSDEYHMRTVKFGEFSCPYHANYPLLLEAEVQINAYLNRDLQKFNLPYEAFGTTFQKNVWLHVSNIDYGNTCSYGAIARKMNMPNASRAVGNANRLNPLPLLIPCHRIIGHHGELTGYVGGLSIKKKLLAIESAIQQSHLW